MEGDVCESSKRAGGVNRKTLVVSRVIKCSQRMHMKLGKVVFANWVLKACIAPSYHTRH